MKPNNPQAFPRPFSQWKSSTGEAQESYRPEEGMTLLDYFAGQALAGLASNGRFLCGKPHDRTLSGSEEIAYWAYMFADAMLAERESRS